METVSGGSVCQPWAFGSASPNWSSHLCCGILASVHLDDAADGSGGESYKETMLKSSVHWQRCMVISSCRNNGNLINT